MANFQKLIDLDGLSYFLGQIKAKFVRSVNGTKPDSKGNVNIAGMEGATIYRAGKAGLAPIPAAGKQDMALCGDATYKVLPMEGGGTGVSAASADALLKALIGSGSIGANNQPIYYKDGRLYAGGYTFRLNHNTSDTKIPVISNGFLDYILKSELANATTGGGIVAANLAENGYVKFSNGLILQWGSSNKTNVDTQVTYPIAFSILYSVVGVPKTSSVLSGSNSNFGIKSQNNRSFIANMYDSGRGYAGFNWCAFGRA